MLSKKLLENKNKKVFIIGKRITDEASIQEYRDAECMLRNNGFSSIQSAVNFIGHVSSANQTAWMKYCAERLVKSDLVFVIGNNTPYRSKPVELFFCQNWCIDLANTLKIPVFFVEYEVVDA